MPLSSIKLELDYLNNYIRRTPELVRAEGDNREDRIVPEEASKFFGCSRLTVDSTLSMPAGNGFYALVTLGGEGVLRGDFEDVPLKRGKSVLSHDACPVTSSLARVIHRWRSSVAIRQAFKSSRHAPACRNNSTQC